MRQMRKTGHYAAFIGLFMAAALTVTACGASAKAPDVSSVVGGSETAADSAVGGTEAAASEADHAGKNGAGTDTAEASGGAAGFQKIDTADKGNSGDTAAAGSGAGQVQPITGAVPADGEVLSGIPIDTEKSEAVSIYYGSVCYSFFSEEKDRIKAVADLFTGFSLEEVPNGQLDEATTYQIYFSTDTEQIAAINVDKSGMFYIPEEKKFYKVKAGTFRFDTLDEIYKDSMYADGFDENQCLIQ